MAASQNEKAGSRPTMGMGISTAQNMPMLGTKLSEKLRGKGSGTSRCKREEIKKEKRRQTGARDGTVPER